MKTRRRWFAASNAQAAGQPAGSRVAMGLIPALLLVTPLVVLLRANGYPLARPEVLLVLLWFSLPGLASALVFRPWFSAVIVAIAAMVFVETRFPSLGVPGMLAFIAVGILGVYHYNLQRIVLAMLVALLVSSLALAQADDVEARPPGHVATRSTEPFVLEIILDEHIGLRGLEAAGLDAASLAREIRGFFAGRGFSVVDGAYSEYAETRTSLAHVFNLSLGSSHTEHSAEGLRRFEWRLTRNRVFESFQARGFALRVFQSDHLDLCGPVAAIACTTYSVKDLGILQDSSLSTIDRAWIVASAHLRYSGVNLLGRFIYQAARDRLTSTGIPLPRWWGYPRISSVNAMRVAADIEEELRQAGPGRVVVAHLLLPHVPYVFNEHCTLLPVAAWENSSDLSRRIRENTADDRLRRYRAYAAQTRCVYRVLGRMLDAIPESVRDHSTILVHGDHGSRIVRHDPETPGAPVTQADLLDEYSTLFAIRSPRVDASIAGLVPLTCLVKASLVSQGPFREALKTCRGTPQVYLPAVGRFAPYSGSDELLKVSHP